MLSTAFLVQSADAVRVFTMIMNISTLYYFWMRYVWIDREKKRIYIREKSDHVEQPQKSHMAYSFFGVQDEK